MEKNYISENLETHFYVNLVDKTYGVCINVKDKDNAQEIIKECIKENLKSINAWKINWNLITA